MKPNASFLAAALAAFLTLPVHAAETTVSGTVVAADDHRLILATRDGLELFDLQQGIERPATLDTDQVVVVRFEDGATPKATAIHRVDEQIVVAEEAGRQSMSLVGTVVSSSRDHVVIRTPSGDEAFVIRPDRIHERPLAPEQKVALIYHADRPGAANDDFTATDLIPIDDFAPSVRAVKVRYSAAATPTATTTADMSEDGMSGDAPAEDRSAPAASDDRWAKAERPAVTGPTADARSAGASDRATVAATLPQTASQWVFVLLAGLGALGTAIVLGRRA